MATANKRWDREAALAVIDDLEASGLSLSAFAKQRALSYERIRKWRDKFRRERLMVRPRLVELVSAPSTATRVVERETRGNLTLRFPSGYSLELQNVALADGVRLLLAAVDERASC